MVDFWPLLSWFYQSRYQLFSEISVAEKIPVCVLGALSSLGKKSFAFCSTAQIILLLLLVGKVFRVKIVDKTFENIKTRSFFAPSEC